MMNLDPCDSEIAISFRKGVRLYMNEPAGTAVLQWQHLEKEASISLGQLSPGLQAAFEQLIQSPTPLSTLQKVVSQKDGFLATPRLGIYLKKFDQVLLMNRTVIISDKLTFTLVPDSPRYCFQGYDILPDQLFCFSRFTYWQCFDKGIKLATPLGHAYIQTTGQQATAVWMALSEPTNSESLGCQLAVSPQVILNLLTLLLNANVLTEVDELGNIMEDEDPSLQQWAFHDLLFHSRTRLGRSLNSFGRTCPFQEKVKPLPPVKEYLADYTVPLYRPNIEHLQESDAPFMAIVEKRRSWRDYDDNAPITAKQLGEFLFRTARVKELLQEDIETKNKLSLEEYPISKRPYPSGGAAYPLEIYLTIVNCQGMVPGFYHYNSLSHELCQLSEFNDKVKRLLNYGRPYPDASQTPQVLITLAARFQRVSWKYESIAYALPLKECGILSMSMHLAATAMGLAGCIIGLGDADLFSELAQTNYYEESCVGEFALGSMANI